MPVRPCLHCGRLSPKSYCPAHAHLRQPGRLKGSTHAGMATRRAGQDERPLREVRHHRTAVEAHHLVGLAAARKQRSLERTGALPELPPLVERAKRGNFPAG